MHLNLDFSPKGQILCCVIASNFHLSRKVPLPLQTTRGLSHGSYVKKAWKHHLIQWVSLSESSEGTWTKFAKTCQKLSGENQLKCLILILFVLFVVSLWWEGRSCLFSPCPFILFGRKWMLVKRRELWQGRERGCLFCFVFFRKGQLF